MPNPNPIEIIETIQVLSALLGTLLTGRALYSCYQDMVVVTSQSRADLLIVAVRRMRQQSLLLLVAVTLLLAGFISLFLGVGDIQSAIRSFAMVVVALVIFILSLTDHIETLPMKHEEQSHLRRRHSDKTDDITDAA